VSMCICAPPFGMVPLSISRSICLSTARADLGGGRGLPCMSVSCCRSSRRRTRSRSTRRCSRSKKVRRRAPRFLLLFLRFFASIKSSLSKILCKNARPALWGLK
jgi:hypothetical protein